MKRHSPLIWKVSMMPKCINTDQNLCPLQPNFFSNKYVVVIDRVFFSSTKCNVKRYLCLKWQYSIISRFRTQIFFLILLSTESLLLLRLLCYYMHVQQSTLNANTTMINPGGCGLVQSVKNGTGDEMEIPLEEILMKILKSSCLCLTVNN